MTQLKKAALLLALIVCLLSCKKEYNSIGLNMEDDLMGTTMETFDVKAWSVLHDTLNTTNMSNQQLGELHDPVFVCCSFVSYAVYGNFHGFV